MLVHFNILRTESEILTVFSWPNLFLGKLVFDPIKRKGRYKALQYIYQTGLNIWREMTLNNFVNWKYFVRNCISILYI